MNINQNKVWELAKEVIELCSIANIPWFISGRSAMRTYCKNLFYKGFLDCEIMMPVESIHQFINVFEKNNPPNRMIESLRNNSSFPGFYMKYVDISTTLIRLNEGKSTLGKGLFIKIIFIKKKPTNISNLMKAKIYEELIYNSSYHFEKHHDNLNIVKLAEHNCKKMVYGNSYTSKMFDELINLYSDEKSNTIIVESIWGQAIEFDKNRFEKYNLFKFENYILHIPDNTEEYFVDISSDKWRNNIDDIILEGEKGQMIVEGANNITSSTISYKQLIPSLRKKGLNNHLFKMRKKVVLRKDKNSELSKEINAAWEYAERAGDFLTLCDEYKEKKQVIINLYRAKEIDVLKDIFSKYNHIVRKYEDKKMCIFYDKEIFDIYLYVLDEYGERDLAENLRDLCKKDELFISEM